MMKQTAGLLLTALIFLGLPFPLLAKRVKGDTRSDASVEQILEQKLSSPILEESLAKGEAGEQVATVPRLPGQGEVSTQDDPDDPRVVDVNFDAVDLTEVVNIFAKHKGVNILLPTGGAAITSKLTLVIDERLTVRKAWELLYSILDIAGYSLIKRVDDYVIVKSDKDVSRNPFPIYIGVAPADLPDIEKRIRYLYYFSNIQVPDIGQESNTELNKIFTTLLPQGSIFKYMPGSNGVLLVAKARDIKAVMDVVLRLDKVGFQEHVDILKLRYTTAKVIADMFTKGILAAGQPPGNRYRIGWRGKSKANYFSKNLKIVSDDRTNSLVLLGRRQAIERVREFIYNYVDIKLDSGKSIFHTYKLQYLDAASFAGTLQNIIDSASDGGTGQSRSAGTAGGPERFFEGVLIRTDMATGGTDGRRQGSNMLLIAARNEDWLRIKALIEELDKPQPQVIIEVLVADLTVKDERILGTHTRTPEALTLPSIMEHSGPVEFQSAQPGQAVADTNLHVDLLNKGGFTSAVGEVVDPLVAMSAAGSTVVSLSDNDGRTWSILQVLQKYENSKILSHPHVVATNNKEAELIIGETRLLNDRAQVGQGGAAIASKDDQIADLTIKITPRIRSGGDTVNLEVSVQLNEFIGDTSNRINRIVQTNANVDTGSVLALGGLIRVDTEQSVNHTPILGRIPILGWLFKRRAGQSRKSSLMVFIRPTIVQPRLRGGIDRYTRDYIRVAKKYAGEGLLFETLREPVTRWFFKTGVDAAAAIDAFASESPQARPIPLDEQDSFLSTSQFHRDQSRSVMAAAEGRKQPRPLELKNDLMDYSSKTDPLVVAERARAPKRRRRRKRGTVAKKQPAQQQVQKIASNEKKAAQPLSKEEQLKKMLAGEGNPLLS